jgi:uncharacterized membrane protein
MITQETGRELSSRAEWLLLAGSIALLLMLGVVLPGGLLDKVDRLGFAACHQIPERTFWINNRPMPLCARCTGSYLGALAGLVLLVVTGRGRARQIPPLRVLIVLVVFVAVWAFDGTNSYLTLLGLPHLYEPRNLYRAITGSLEGLSISVLVLPFLTVNLWARTEAKATVRSLKEVAILPLVAAAVVLALQSGVADILYPLALLSTVGLLLLFSVPNTVAITLILGRDGKITRRREAAAYFVAGLALSLAEMTGIALWKGLVTHLVGLPLG